MSLDLEQEFRAIVAALEREGIDYAVVDDNLIRMKLAAGRTRDIADVERLREMDR